MADMTSGMSHNTLSSRPPTHPGGSSGDTPDPTKGHSPVEPQGSERSKAFYGLPSVGGMYKDLSN